MAENYLPDIRGTLDTQGRFKIRDSGDTFKAVAAIGVFAFIWTSFSVGMWLVVFSEGEWFAVAFLTLFVLIGVFLCYQTYKRYKIWQRFTPGEVLVAPWPLSPGTEASFTYRRQPRKATRMRYLDARLELEEKVQYQQGTDVRTATHTVWSHQLGERDLSSRNRQAEVEETFTYTLPKHLPASVHISRNELIWRLVVDLHYGGNSDDDSSFNLLVTPCAARGQSVN